MATKHFYSAVRKGFFHSDVHGDAIPTDAVEISREEWQRLLDGQCRDGARIVADQRGRPYLSMPPPPSAAQP